MPASVGLAGQTVSAMTADFCGGATTASAQVHQKAWLQDGLSHFKVCFTCNYTAVIASDVHAFACKYLITLLLASLSTLAKISTYTKS